MACVLLKLHLWGVEIWISYDFHTSWNIIHLSLLFSCSGMSNSLRPHGLLHARLPSFTVSRVCSNSSPLSWWNQLFLCCSLLLLLSIFSIIEVFSSESVLRIRWPNYWSFSFSISPSSEFSGLISFRTDWFDLAVQQTLKSLLQHHNSNLYYLIWQENLYRCEWIKILEMERSPWVIQPAHCHHNGLCKRHAGVRGDDIVKMEVERCTLKWRKGP